YAADSRICCHATGRYQAPRCARHGWARLGCAAWPRAYLGARAGTNGSGGSLPRACLEAMGRGARPSEAIRRGMKEGTILLNNRVAIALTSATTAVTAAALTATLGLAAASWVVAVRQMNGQMNGTNMGVATPLGLFAFFMALWVAMMAAMMLPGAAPAVLRSAHARGARSLPWFVALYRPHGSFAAGALVIAAGGTSSRRSSSTSAGGAAGASALDSSSDSAASARASD